MGSINVSIPLQRPLSGCDIQGSSESIKDDLRDVVPIKPTPAGGGRRHCKARRV